MPSRMAKRSWALPAASMVTVAALSQTRAASSAFESAKGYSGRLRARDFRSEGSVNRFACLSRYPCDADFNEQSHAAFFRKS